MRWTLSISTLITDEARILNFLRENKTVLHHFDEVLLICQLRDKPLPEFPSDVLPANARVVESKLAGISASRNLGIEHFTTDLIWFMDDDAKLVSNLPEIKAAIEKSSAEINTLRIQDTESDELFKPYGPGRNLSALDLLKVSSIEVTCKRTLFDRTGIRFPEWIGVGTALPSGEENLFLHEARRRGAVIAHLPIIACRHPVMTPEIKSIWSRPNRTRCMGIVAREYGVVGALLCLRWALRGIRARVEPQRLFDMWDGYVRGPRHWKKV
jgi:hypothetical protein